MNSTSPTLLAQLAGTDRASAWPRFVHLYTPLFDLWAARLGVRPADRPDLIQEVFLGLLRSLPRFVRGPGAGFRAWLYTVFVNKWKDQCRKRVPSPVGIGGSSFPAAVEDPTTAVDEAEYRAVLAARAARLIRADFNDATWAAFWATAVEDRPAAEVAAELGLSANAVYLARSRVLQRLRRELDGLLD